MDQNIKLKIAKKLCKIQLINGCFPRNLEQYPKMCWKNFAKTVLFAGDGVWKSLAHGPKYQIKNHQKIVKKINMNGCFPKNLELSSKICWKKFANVLFARDGVWKSVAHGPKYQVKNHQKSVQNSAHKRFFPKIWNNLQKSAGKNFARVLFAC